MLSDIQLAEAKELFDSKDGQTTIHFERVSRLDKLKEFLTRKRYSRTFEDCWMFHDGKNIDQSRFDQVKKVENETDLEIFLETMSKCFQKNDPQNPYGELGEYLNVAKTSWLEFRETDRLEYFIVYKEDQPVAVSSLTTYKKLGYISNVGSLKSVRGEGFGKLATLYAVDQSVRQGNEYHFLGTEEGNFPYKFYKRLGFINRFRAIGWSK
ncbi:hypothetical protein BH10PAT2_BH10PAT2_1040 [soil metagenome]